MQTRLPNGQIVYQEDYSCIIQPQNGKGGIFIGNLQAAQNMKTLKSIIIHILEHGIRAILTAAKGVDLNHPKSQIPFYLQVPGQDRDGFDMTRYFVQGVNFIKDALDTTSIMVHCLAGVSRSVCLVLAYFIKCRGFTYDEAYDLVKLKRNIIHPNEGFIAQLRKYESQVRTSPSSPSRYEISSPSKRRYQYYYEKEQQIQPNRINPQSFKYEQLYTSPSKRGKIQSYYAPPYESPSKKGYHDLLNQTYESPTKNMTSSPMKKRTYQGIQSRDQPIFESSPAFELRRLNSYKQRNGLDAEIQLRHFSPQRRRVAVPESRGRSNSILDIKDNKTLQANKLYGNYDRLRHTSAIQLSEQLDNKIAAIRQKYSEYSKNQMNISKRISARQSEPRPLDQNELTLGGAISMKKISSEYEGIRGKVSEREYGIVNNSFGRTSGVGLGLRKLNSLREGY